MLWVANSTRCPISVPHRQYVFTLPKLVRPFFRYRRRYLGALCQIVARLLKADFRTIETLGQPAFILYVQTFGDLVTFNLHIHALVADGVFLPSGTFRVLPPLPETEQPQAVLNGQILSRNHNLSEQASPARQQRIDHVQSRTIALCRT